ncbi:molybdopterin-dependent oxidoreductase [Salinivibrio sp. ES.052]|uniref:molybdopterin-dependent oxidoreductase n=1 Tax=Salinivibrio sp. ES.052 TaxID=1882823 RepID=UPI0009291E99|nr:molybdopterin-dependent oxidoreductase [Salinivibrio sp. ES.052]SIN91484.1 hypothetical protein SAMN05444724_1191 [Salinivibrio sp. ES.052]
MKEKPSTVSMAAPFLLLCGVFQPLRVATVMVSLFVTFSTAASLHVPINLTVRASPEQSMLFDRQKLEALPQAHIITQTPFTRGQQRFDGVALSTVLDAAGVGECANVNLKSMNRYQSVLSLNMAVRYHPMIAMKRNGQAMTLRTLGPLWLVFPLDQYPEIQNDQFYSAMVWQLTDIECLR